MFNTTGRSSSTSSLTGLDMWDKESCFQAQSSAWCGMSEVSGSGFLPTASQRFRQRNPSLRKWKSSHLLPELGPGLFSSPGAVLTTTRSESRFRQSGVMQWLQDAHKHLDSHLDQLNNKDKELNYNLKHTELLDMSQKKVDPVLSELRQRLKGAEEKATTLEKERNKAHQLLKTSSENQKALHAQIEEINQTVTTTKQQRSEIQEQLREANNNISQACLDKAKLSTEVLKLENRIKELELKLTEALSAKKHLIKGNEKLKKELEILKYSVKESQHQLEGLHQESTISSEKSSSLEKECSHLIGENEDQRRRNDTYKPSELSERNRKSPQQRDELELKNQRLWDQCLCLQADVQEKDRMLNLQENQRKQGLENVTEKWQNVAQSLQDTQEELNQIICNPKHERELDLDSLLHLQLDACKQELQKNSKQTPANTENSGSKALQSLDRWTQTGSSESSLLCETSLDKMCLPSGELQRLMQKLKEREMQMSQLQHALRSLEGKREKEKSEAQIRISALELKLSARVSGSCHEDGNLEKDALVTALRRNRRYDTNDIQKKMHQLEIKKMLVAQDLQTIKKPDLVKEEKTSVEDKAAKSVCLETDLQRRMVNEQLKSLFKEQEEKQAGKVNTTAAAAAKSYSSHERTPTTKPVRAAADRRNWQNICGLTPVLEEDEESSDSPEELEGYGNGETLPDQRQQMSATFSNPKKNNDSQQQEIFSCREALWDLPTAEPLTCLDNSKRKWMWSPPLYPDGIFSAEIVNICSPDEDEGEGDVK